MTRLAALLGLTLVLALSSGCTTHMPLDGEPVHLAIRWRPSFEKAVDVALAAKKPVLLVCAAGEKTGFC
jgi:hypothetical protein